MSAVTPSIGGYQSCKEKRRRKISFLLSHIFPGGIFFSSETPEILVTQCKSRKKGLGKRPTERPTSILECITREKKGVCVLSLKLVFCCDDCLRA